MTAPTCRRCGHSEALHASWGCAGYAMSGGAAGMVQQCGCVAYVAPVADVYAVASDFVTRAGLTYRILDHWTSRGYLHADETHPGTGRNRRWPATELAVAEEMLRLTRAGVLPAAAAQAARNGGRLAPGIAVTT